MKEPKEETLPKMRLIAPDGPYVLAPTMCSVYRKGYFERSNQILGFQATITAYSGEGQKRIDLSAEQNQWSNDTKVRIKIGQYTIESTHGAFKRSFRNARIQLTNQTFIMIYGNFEAYLFDCVRNGLEELSQAEPFKKTLDFVMARKWEGKLDNIGQKLGLQIGKGTLKNQFAALEMGFFGERCEDPIEFLQRVTELRHRLVHSNGRVDDELRRKYPAAAFRPNELISLPFDLPYQMHLFFVMFTDVLDVVFATKFKWPRVLLAPEQLLSPQNGGEEENEQLTK